jgi:hypothetical protein
MRSRATPFVAAVALFASPSSRVATYCSTRSGVGETELSGLPRRDGRAACENGRMMDFAEREAMARAIVDGNSYMTLGTADGDGRPWVSPVWFAPASYREFFWVSKPGARHSHNITVRPEVGIVIFDSTVPISTGKAVYMAARAQQVTAADEIERGVSVFSRRSLEQGGREWTPDDVGPTAHLRLYRATASEQFVLSPEDERLPFSLE